MQIYQVGGSVRDALLGLEVADRDYVVVGATPEAMVALGYQPVGADFPVFLHPETHEEYALARTERKTAPGYSGFVFHTSTNVTLDEDLKRRDLTINAMARAADGTLIDPHGGEHDLRAGVLRHVSAAFVEDPVRLLRVARFAARFGFAIAPETMALMRAMVDNGEVDHLVPERVWQEVSRGLMTGAPSRLFAALVACGALVRVWPELASYWDAALAQQLDRAATANEPLAVRYAVLLHRASQAALTQTATRIKPPNECQDLAGITLRCHVAANAVMGQGPDAVLDLLLSADAPRRPARFEAFLAACQIIHAPASAIAPTQYPQRAFLAGACQAITGLDYQSAADSADPAATVRALRLAALDRFIHHWRNP